MSYTLIDFFNGFQSLKRRKRFSAGTQSTYFAILAEFNSAYFPESISISTRDLQQLAGLKSVSSAHECRNVLKNNNLIDFKTKNCTTVYRLLTEHLPNKNGLGAEHQPNANRTAGGLFNIPACEDSRLKTETEDERRARAHEQTDAGGIETPKVARKREESGNVTTSDDPSPHALPNPLKSPEKENDIFKVWQEEVPDVYLNARQRYELAEIAEENFEKAKEAIMRMSDTRQYKSFEAFKEKIEEMGVKTKKKKTALKGGERNGRKRYDEEEQDPREKWEYSNR